MADRGLSGRPVGSSGVVYSFLHPLRKEASLWISKSLVRLAVRVARELTVSAYIACDLANIDLIH